MNENECKILNGLCSSQMLTNELHTTSAARGSAANWINAGNPIEKNSRVNLFFSFGRSELPSSLLSITSEPLEDVIRSWLSRQLLFPILLVHTWDGRGSESPFTPIDLSDGDKHSADSSRRDSDATKTIYSLFLVMVWLSVQNKGGMDSPHSQSFQFDNEIVSTSSDFEKDGGNLTTDDDDVLNQ